MLVQVPGGLNLIQYLVDCGANIALTCNPQGTILVVGGPAKYLVKESIASTAAKQKKIDDNYVSANIIT